METVIVLTTVVQLTAKSLLFRSSSILTAIPQGGIRFASYEILKQQDKLPSICAVILSDVMTSLIKVPREIIEAKRIQSPHLSLSSSLALVYQEKGISGFFKGFLSTTMRDWPFMGLLFSIQDDLNRKKPLSHLGWHPSVEVGAYGAFSGGLSAFLTHPLDAWRIHQRSFSFFELALSSNNLMFKGALNRTFFWFVIAGVFFPLYGKAKTIYG